MAHGFVLLLVALFVFPFTQAASSTCTAVASVSNCVKSINSSFTKTKSLSSFCSSILKCTTTPTVTLSGTTTETISRTFSSGYTDSEEIKTLTSFTTITYTYSASVATGTTTIHPTYVQEKWVITTVQPGHYKREDESHPKDLARRASSVTSVCLTTAESKACSCLITCPTTVTKDKRKIITTTESYEVDYVVTTVYYTGTETHDDVAFVTDVSSYISTSKIFATSTHTRTLKCTPSAPNSSFFLRATNVPDAAVTLDVANKWVTYHHESYLTDFVPEFYRRIDFTANKANAIVWHLTDRNRLGTQNVQGDIFANTDYFSFSFEPTGLMTRAEMTLYNWLAWTCTLSQASGRFPGNHQELNCQANFNPPLDPGTPPTNIFQYCSGYEEAYDWGLILANNYDDAFLTNPPCANITLLVVPVCS
ncbi:hypothetical protein TWF694_006260 [Orbilia ellipsospora]|uniref:Uncharacterized protein n=1 Tax=Orbilia ellipsospora TaxID=2528407 RepID=A0AAV9XJK2_9PEZI